MDEFKHLVCIILQIIGKALLVFVWVKIIRGKVLFKDHPLENNKTRTITFKNRKLRSKSIQIESKFKSNWAN